MPHNLASQPRILLTPSLYLLWKACAHAYPPCGSWGLDAWCIPSLR
jgi:hypothetical protein